MQRRIIAVLGATALAVSLLAAPAQGAEGDSPTIEFQASSGDAMDDVVSQLVANYGAPTVAAYFRAVAASPKSGTTMPGLSINARMRRGQAQAIADATVAGRALPASVANLPVAPVARPTQVAPAAVTPSSISTAPVVGAVLPGTANRAWQMKPILYAYSCVLLSCKVVDHMDFTLTINPGFTGSRTDVNIVAVGDGTLGRKATITTKLYRGASKILVNAIGGSVTLNVPGSGKVWLSQYSSIAGQEFQFWTSIVAKTQGGEGNSGVGRCSYDTVTGFCHW